MTGDRSYKTLEVTTEEGVAWLTLRRAPTNAIDATMAAELADVTARLEDDELGCLVLSASGPHFCVGGDLRAFVGQGDRLPAYLRRMVVDLHTAISRLLRMPAPTIAAVNGTAAGAGLSLVLATDLAIAARSTRFSVAYTRVGLTPDGGSTWLLPRVIGARRARELALTNRLLGSEEAHAWGLVNEVVSDDDLTARARAVALRLAGGPRMAFDQARRLLLSSSTQSLETQMELEARAIIEIAATADAREGMAALLGKRDPGFGGHDATR
jgi:2-(1,2-epoxy-1,2-dihydrophenyl)acetyl-CoA isomerase